MRRLRVSPAMMVALLALFVALSGVGVAGTTALINGSQIKDHTIGLSKLTPGTIAALRGHAGPAGHQGPAGPAGGFDPNKVTYVQGPTTTVQPVASTSTATTLSATCPSGTKAIAGGGFTSIAIVGASLVSTDGTSWNLVVINPADFPLDGLFAFVVCAAK
jgi:hypothetical protein